MNFFLRSLRAVNAGIGRMKVSGIQANLRLHLANSEIDVPRVKELIGEICIAAWNIGHVSNFFKNHGFSFEDYTSMYTAMILAFPNVETKRKNLIATDVMVDNFSKLEHGFNSISRVVSGMSGDERWKVSGKLLIDSFNDLVRSRPDLFST